MDPYILQCPHCHEQFDVHPDDEICHAHDNQDGLLTTCEVCGEHYRLTTKTEVFFFAYKPSK